MGVGGERERHPGLDAELGEATRRVELADRLADPRGRELDRRAALDHRFDRRLVEAPQVALGQRPVPAPDLDQVRVGEDLEEAGAGAFAEGVEVAAPDLLRIGARPPDVEALVVDRGVAVADEVDRADDVVEVAGGEQLAGPLLGPGDEVALDPEPQRRRADELAVGVEVVAGVLGPERVGPEVEGGGEAVDVLGDAELLDPPLAGGGQVALDVLGGEIALGRWSLPRPGADGGGSRSAWPGAYPGSRRA